MPTAVFVRCLRGGGAGAVLRDMSSLRWCRIWIVLRCWCGRVSSCPALCGEMFLLAAAALTHAPLVPTRLISSPILLSPLVRRSVLVLLLGRWSLPAGPGIVLLMPRMSLLLLPWLRMLWLRLLPRLHLLRATLLLVATTTIVVALG